MGNVNKVTYNGPDGERVLIDLTNDTVAPETVLEGYKAHGADGKTFTGTYKPSAGGGSSDEEWIGDGNTHIWIHLEDGRTSPMLGCCPNGTVTVDWGDGTAKDTLTGTSLYTVKWTPTHNYAAPGDYVITLTVNMKASLYGSSANKDYSYILHYAQGADQRNQVFQSAVQRVEIGKNMLIGGGAFRGCYSLSKVKIPEGLTEIGSNAFTNCYSLSSITIPSSVRSIYEAAFHSCASLTSVIIPDGVTSIYRHTFRGCHALSNVTIPNGLKDISSSAFHDCYSLSKVEIPKSVTEIEDYAFYNCYSLSKVKIPDSVTSIGRGAFNANYSAHYYDFTACTRVPTLKYADGFSGMAADCEIRVPAALYDEWKAATNWSKYADHIVAV